MIAGEGEAGRGDIDLPCVLAKHIGQVKLVFQGQEGRVAAQPGNANRSGHVDLPPGAMAPAAGRRKDRALAGRQSSGN